MAFGLAGILTAVYCFCSWVRDEYPEFWIGARLIMFGITFLGVMGATAYLQEGVQRKVNESGEATELDNAIAREDSLSRSWKDAAGVNADGRYWALVKADKHAAKADSLRLERGELNTTGAGAENALYMQLAKVVGYNVLTISLIRNAAFSILLDFIFAFIMKVWLRMRKDRLNGSRRERKARGGKTGFSWGFRKNKAPAPSPAKGGITPGNPQQSANVKKRIEKLRKFLIEFDGTPSMKEMIDHMKLSENTIRKYLKIISEGGST